MKDLAKEEAPGREQRRLLMAGAHFYDGIHKLATGRRAEAVAALTRSWQQYDNENYCFRAKMIVCKLQADATWPDWLSHPRGETP